MKLRSEAYLSTQIDHSEQRYVLVVYQEGRGKFKIRRQINLETNSVSYNITSFGARFLEAREEVLASIPLALEDLFKQGALAVSYIEGDVLIEFPADYSERFNPDQLDDLAELSIKGTTPLIKDFAEPLFSSFDDQALNYPVTALQLCVFVVLGISLIMFYYGNSVLPLEWLGVTSYSFAAVVMLGCLFSGFTRSLLNTGKVLALCFFCASAILSTLLIGVLSKEINSSPPLSKEGIIESMFEGTESNVMRIRLASKPNTTYLVSKEYLKGSPERLPQAIRLKILTGFFNTHYVKEVELVQ